MAEEVDCPDPPELSLEKDRVHLELVRAVHESGGRRVSGRRERDLVVRQASPAQVVVPGRLVGA